MSDGWAEDGGWADADVEDAGQGVDAGTDEDVVDAELEEDVLDEDVPDEDVSVEEGDVGSGVEPWEAGRTDWRDEVTVEATASDGWRSAPAASRPAAPESAIPAGRQGPNDGVRPSGGSGGGGGAGANLRGGRKRLLPGAGKRRGGGISGGGGFSLLTINPTLRIGGGSRTTTIGGVIATGGGRGAGRSGGSGRRSMTAGQSPSRLTGGGYVQRWAKGKQRSSWS